MDGQLLSMYLAANPKMRNRLGPGSTPITYTIVYQPINAGVAQVPASVQTAGDFLCMEIMGAMTTSVTNLNYILTPMIIQIIITATNYNFTSQKTEWGTSGMQINPSSGTDSKPLHWPLFVKNAATITTQLDNPAAAAANVWITFSGIQLAPGDA